MSDPTPTRPQHDIIPTHPTYGAPQGHQQGAPQGWSPAQPPVPTQGGYPMGYGQPHHVPVGKIRSTGLCIMLAIVTFGIYPLVWFYSVHSEMKRHSGNGIDGGIALVLALFVAIVMPYLTSSEVGGLYERRGQRAPVSGATGLWYFPGMFILVGPLVWFIKTNGALNSYWRTQGAV